jgi:hypothetical protein
MAWTGTIFSDTNSNGVQDAGEPGILGIRVTIDNLGGNDFHTQGTTDANGNYSAPDIGAAAQAYRVTVVINQRFYNLTTANPNPWNTSLAQGDTIAPFGFHPGTYIKKSSWVYSVVFLSGIGVQVTFHHKGNPYVTVVYPNTTQDDADAIIHAASLGRAIHWFYSARPYYVVPLAV